MPPLSPNNLIFNNIGFRYGFAFHRYLHFFSITFPDSWFVVIQQGIVAPIHDRDERQSETAATARFFQQPARLPAPAGVLRARPHRPTIAYCIAMPLSRGQIGQRPDLGRNAGLPAGTGAAKRRRYVQIRTHQYCRVAGKNQKDLVLLTVPNEVDILPHQNWLGVVFWEQA